LQPARLEFVQAEELYRDHVRGGVAELRCCRMLYARVLAMLAQWDDLARCDAWIREAEQCEDLVTAARLRMIGIPRMLMEGDLDAAESALRIPEPLVGPTADLTQLLRVLGEVSVVLYRDDPDAAEAMLHKADEIDSSPLFALRLWRSDHLVNRARLFMIASRSAEHPEERLAEVERCIETIEMLALECQMDHARILRAGLFHRRGDTQAALHELNTILSDADMGGDSRIIRACARMRKGQLLGGDEGEMMISQSQRELRTWGAKDPERFARVYSPGFGAAGKHLRVVAVANE
jgi:hypothetical protein